MIKPASALRPALGSCIFIILFLPYKFVQAIAISGLLLIAISYVWARALEKGISVERNEGDIKTVTFEKLTISFTITNKSSFPALMCYVLDNLPFLHVFEKGNERLFALRAHERKTIFYQANAMSRGLYKAGPVKVRTYDPLGLFTIDKEIECSQRILVRPARIQLKTIAHPGLPQGNIKINNPIYEDITMRRCLREYKNGDELKRINWRASAKFNSLFTNEYENTFDAPFFVFLNLAKDDYPLNSCHENGEKAIEIAASIINIAARLKQRCGFAAYGSGFPFIKPGENQADCILDMLSLIQMEDGKLNYDPEKKLKEELSTGTLLFIVGPEEVSLYKDKISAKQYGITTASLGIMKDVRK